MHAKRLFPLFLLAILISPAAATSADDLTYQKPPQDILDCLNAPAPPLLSVSPTRDYALVLQPLRYPPIADVAQPMLRLAGLRIDVNTNGPHLPFTLTAVTLKRLADGADIPLTLPAGMKLSAPIWSPDGQHFALTNTTPHSIDLYLADTATGNIHRIEGVRLNAVMDSPVAWLPNSQTLLLRLVPANRGAAPAESPVPRGPHVQESSGRSGPVTTFEDMLNNPHDEDLFDYYATAQLAYLDCASGALTPVGPPAIYDDAEPSPDGRHLLISRVHKPYSYLYPVSDFPLDIEVWNHSGERLYQVAALPLADRIPIQGVRTGPRSVRWQPAQPAALVWAEAMDGGNPKEKVPHRDRLLTFAAPFHGEPQEIFETEERFQTFLPLADGHHALVSDYERDKRWQRVIEINTEINTEIKTGHIAAPGRTLFARNVQDEYKDPGRPVMQRLPNGQSVVRQTGSSIFLEGLGASPTGEHPFLDRFDLSTGKTERLFQSEPGHYESVVAVLDDQGHRLLTRRESPTEPPNYFLRLGAQLTPLTHIPDPTPQLHGITKRLVTYQREDGVPLSFTLYLPPNYKEGTRLPTLVWAYPLEYNDAATAGQVRGSTDRYPSFAGANLHLLFLLHGYAILDSAAMPVIGTPETVNNTYIQQVVMDSKAAIDKAVDMGVTDRNRVGVGGHSYGAFMTANLLAHCDLFHAGVAESGAYNRTLTPFGFQTERRILWEAPDIYLRMSPFLSADKIKTPILLIHGEADNNTGTFPIQSERMYQAIRGNGGTVRLVMLPLESHGYAARETIEHVLWEELHWFDKYLAPGT